MPRKKGYEIEIDPDLVRLASQNQSKRPSSALNQAAQSSARVGIGSPRQSANMGGKQRKKSRRSGVDVDPDLKLSETETSRTPSNRSSPQPSLITSASPAGYGTPIQRSTAPTLQQPPGTASRAHVPSARIAGRYSTPASRLQGPRSTASSTRGRSGKQNYLDIDDIDDSSPEKPKHGHSTAIRQVSRTARAGTRPREAVRPPSGKPERRSSSPSALPKVAHTRQTHDPMDIDDDSIHSSSPPEYVSDSMNGDSPEGGGNEDMMDDDLATMPVDQEMVGSGEDDHSDGSRDRNMRSVSNRLDALHSQVKEAKTQGRPQFLKPPKFTFKNDKPREGPQFLSAPAFIFHAPKAPTANAPNPRKYIFKEDIRLPTTSPDPLPEPEPEMLKRRRRPALRCVPGALTKTLAERLSEVSQKVPERLLKEGIDEVLLEASMVQRIGTKKNKFYLVRGYLEKNGRVVCVMLPGSGPQVSPSGETYPAKSTEILPGETIGVKGLRWVIALEGIKWIVAPDWFVVREKPEVIKRNVFRHGIAEAFNIY